MLFRTLQDTYLLILPASLVILCTIIFFRKRRYAKTAIPEEIKTQRIFSFQPEPLIAKDAIKQIGNKIIELPQPDESDSECLNLAKVNYLNILNDQEIRKEAETCIRTYGVGSCGPRGFYGTIDIHLSLESRIAEFMGMEETVLYSYGFSAISSAIAAYCKRSDVLFCDEKVTFAAGQGLAAAKSHIVYFKHNDMEDLEIKLIAYEKKEDIRKRLYRKFLIVEGIYALTGTICPLPKLMELRKKYKLRIFLDESLSIGVLGKTGRGVSEHFDVDRSDIDMIMGSLEGPIGSIGGFCVGASVVIEHQRLSGLGYCFSASLPPFLSHISICAINMFERDPEMFQRLESVSVMMDKYLRELSFYEVISDPLSPLKVLSVKSNDPDIISKIQDFSADNKMYMLRTDDYLQLNVNIKMNEDVIKTIAHILKLASLLYALV